MGHTHHLLVDNSDIHLEPTRRGNLAARTKHYLVSGCYMRTYEIRPDGSAGYGERRHYSPSALGCGHIEFIPSERVIRAHDWWT